MTPDDEATHALGALSDFVRSAVARIDLDTDGIAILLSQKNYDQVRMVARLDYISNAGDLKNGFTYAGVKYVRSAL